MDTEVVGPDAYGNDAYRQLYDTIMNDAGKGVLIERSKLVLKPEIPLFIFSVRLINEPVQLHISDAASVRQENKDVYLAISDERYAPEILSQLWGKYGRAKVEQQTRFDIVVSKAKEKDIMELPIASGEEAKKEIIGAMWRAMPEGIKVRHNISEKNVITIVATEEKMLPDMIEEGEVIHKEMLAKGGSKDV